MFLLVVNQLVCSLSMPSTIPQMKKRCFFFLGGKGGVEGRHKFFYDLAPVILWDSIFHLAAM